jgi:hypothetical protein
MIVNVVSFIWFVLSSSLNSNGISQTLMLNIFSFGLSIPSILTNEKSFIWKWNS